MYADVERVRFDAARHFLRVIQQQGRVLMAAETNEQVAILLHHIQALAADLIGPGGTSRADNGFALTMAGSDIAVGPGHYWVAGRLCEVEPGSAVSYLRQPDYDAPPVPLTGTHVVYLDVWERHVSAAEDPGLVEVALAGPDSCTRTKQVWQIKIRPDVANATPNSVRNKWASIEDALGRLAVGGRLSAAVGQVPRATTPCLAAPTSGYTRGENQLLRVEVHCGGPLTENPTVKWAWDNASVAHRVRQVSGSTVVLAAPPRDARSGLAKGTRVELQSDIQVRDGRPGVLTTVQGVEDDGDDYRVILAADPDCEFKEDERDERERPRWALLRRWDHTGTKLVDGALELVEGKPMPLADGVEVTFAPPDDATRPWTYHAGDYWTIPVRVATGDVIWPRDAQDKPLARPPEGVEHGYTPLAVLTNGSLSDARMFVAPPTPST